MFQKRILVIDDEPEHAELIALLLRRRGHLAEVARDARAALLEVAADPPDLLILDYIMPGIDGLSAALELRRDARTEALPIMIMTACGEEALRARGTLPPRTRCLEKPFRLSELLWAVEDALGGVPGEVGAAAP